MIDTALRHDGVLDKLRGNRSVHSGVVMTDVALAYIEATRPAPEQLAGVIHSLNALMDNAYESRISQLAAEGILPMSLGLPAPGTLLALISLINVAGLLSRFLHERKVDYARALAEMMSPYFRMTPQTSSHLAPLHFFSRDAKVGSLLAINTAEFNRCHFDAVLRKACTSFFAGRDSRAAIDKKMVDFFAEEGPEDVWEDALTHIASADDAVALDAIWPSLCEVGKIHALRRSLERPSSSSERASECLQWMLRKNLLTDDQAAHGMRWAMGGPDQNCEHKKKYFYNDVYAALDGSPDDLDMQNISALMLHSGVRASVVHYCIGSHERGMPLSTVDSLLKIALHLVHTKKLTSGDRDKMIKSVRKAKEKFTRAARSAASSASARLEAASRRGVASGQNNNKRKRRTVRAGAAARPLARAASASPSRTPTTTF